MKTYFEVKAKYTTVTEEGKNKKVSDVYLIDALSVTEAEARAAKELREVVSGDFSVNTVAESNIKEVMPMVNGDRWFKCKVSYSIEDDNGKIKSTNEYCLVWANNVGEAYSVLYAHIESLANISFSIPSVQESNISEVFEYVEK